MITSVIMSHEQGGYACSVAAVKKKSRICSAEALDALVVITDHKHVPIQSAQEVQQFKLKL